MTEVDFEGTTRFQIRRRLGEGGMGVVYEAFDRDRQVTIALKTLRKPGPDAILRLKNEFRALQDLQHRNLVSLGELYEESGTWFFTMELVRGCTLLEYVRPGSASERDGATAVTDAAAVPDVRATAQTALNLVAQDETAAAGPTVPASATATGFDETRLRDTFAQLSRGLIALHRAGKVHRDIKPSNILVDEQGRVVLLDFGLVADTQHGPALTEVGVVGTAAYMAPEQALGKTVGPEADWYALGVVLYEAMTGSLPFTGSSLHILMEKQRQSPLRPVTHIARVPADLDRLCVELLEYEPSRRPGGEAVLERLGARDAAPARMTTRPGTTMTQTFVGREPELAQLEGALADVREGRLVCAYVHGESGIGKSALVHTFCQRATADDRVTVLSGRCYEREAVPYRVLDGVIDHLSRYLARLPKPDAAALLPQRVSLLLQVFPVLRRVDVFADAPRHEAVDPQELRTRAFGALRELIGRLSDRRTLILAIDDLQWADADGLALLSELLRPPESPSLLLVGSWRETGEDAGGVRRALDALPGEARHMRLTRLPEAAARELAEHLLVHAGIGGSRAGQRAATIAREAVGHPLFIDELVRESAIASSSTTGRDTTNRPLRLEEVLWGRIERLDTTSRRVLEVVSVATRPIDQETAARAAALDLTTFGRHAALLRVANLVRTKGSRASDTVEPYHDRVRTAVLQHLGDAARVERHRELARALDASGRADPQHLVEHYRGAREPERAGLSAAQAATAAARAFAFDQAASLLSLALELLPAEHAARRGLRVQLGDALASAGRGPEAARAYLDASQGASPADALDLRLRAAQQYLLTGHIDEGIVTMRDFLEREGVHFPRTPRAALATVVLRRAQLALRGLRFHERDESLVAPMELKRLDACYHVGMTLGLVDHILGQAFNARGLLLALRAGEPYRLARALITEGGFRAAAGGKGLVQGEKLLATAESLAGATPHPHVTGLAAATRAQTMLLCGQFSAAVLACDKAQSIFAERCQGASWEMTTLMLWRCRALMYLGDLEQLARRVPELLREFGRVSNHYASTALGVTAAPLLEIVADQPAAARAGVAEALRHWSPEGFHIQHYYAHVSDVASLLYEGNAATAYDLVQVTYPRAEKAFLLRVAFIHTVMLDLRARAALATADHHPERVTDAARDAARIARVRQPWAIGLATLLEAGVASRRGDAAGARAKLTEAVAIFEGADMAMHAAVARRRLGLLLGGETGAGLVASADAAMKAQRVVSVERFTAMLAP